MKPKPKQPQPAAPAATLWQPARRANAGHTAPRTELLAPAGDAASLQAALQCGADAVYFGLQEGFNARARAGNFSLANLGATVESIHACGARAYLTLNTLLFEPELAHVEEILRQAAAAGIDAVLVQDPAVALAAQRVAPELEIHASTQMTISSPEAAVFAADLGAVRVVLPRELSVREIATFMRGTTLETEVFVHGALCVSWSGQCLSSEAWGGRSANRGQCAQSCRMPYDLIVDGEPSALGDVRYLLSPKDLAGVRAVPELMALGVHGLKIEGRQKGPEYVATAVSAYRRWVDAVAANGADPKKMAVAERTLHADLLATSLAYSRGFGDGFLAGSDHQTLVEGRFPKHRGVYLGRVVRVGTKEVVVEVDKEGRPWTGALAVPSKPRVKGSKSSAPQGDVSAPLPALGGSRAAASGASLAPLEVKPGMGVVFDAGHPEDTREAGGPVFRVGREGECIVLGFGTPGPDLRHVEPGERVWVTSDPVLARATERVLRTPVPTTKTPVDVSVSGKVGAPLHLEARSGGRRATAKTQHAAIVATGTGLDEKLLAAKLGALGETEFELGGLDIRGLAPGLQIPVSDLKEARRALVQSLRASFGDDQTDRVAAKPKPTIPRPHFALPALAPADALPHVVPLCRNPAQLAAALQVGCDEVELDWMELVGLGAAVEQARAAGARVTLATLRVQKPDEAAFDERLARLNPDAVLVRHWGGMVAFARLRADEPERFAHLRIHGDFALNVTNSVTAAHLLGWGLDSFTAAHDLDERQLFGLLDKTAADRCTVVIHHRIPTFHTEHCVYAHLMSEGRDYKTCGRPCETHEIGLRDHLGRTHPVIVDAGCRNTVFNGEIQSAARLVPGLLARGVRRFRVEFVREGRDEAAAVLTAYRDLIAGRTTAERLLGDLGVAGRQGVTAGSMRLLIEPAASSTSAP